MKRSFVSILLCSMLVLPFATQAREREGESKRRGGSGGAGVAANCAAPSESRELAVNNIRALIQSGGDMWWDLAGQARYEIPAGSGRTALFAGSLWLGGQDISGQLKVAAQRFRSNGNDFWTGPLSTVDAEITPETCIAWDDFFHSSRAEVQKFISWNEAKAFDAQNGTNTAQESFPDYSVPEFIINWPAHGRTGAPYFEDKYLAPFADVNGDGEYSWEDGDYPRYNFDPQADCGQAIVDIYGDQNLWWIFNDKGNIHTETGANSIGMEIRAQAFGFSTNDEVNNMTFYNYELLNRSTFTLTETYFGFWVDSDLGNAQDDYVGCDVERGLGYAYNGDENDEDNGGALGYGTNPPAIGVDFFQGPFQDADNEANCLCDNYADAIDQDGVVYKGSGVGYDDDVVDNERLGMRAFLYHNNGNGIRDDPDNGTDYYNYLRSIWKDNSTMVYGGTGHRGSVPPPHTEALYMFPGDSDPLGWGTGGVTQPIWTEVTAGNTVGDRRFIQSAGPFTLAPGAKNNITVGVVWSRAKSGGAQASVETLRKADDKTQALFDACFQLIDGPDAPNLEITELDGELIIKVVNPQSSNNFNERYAQIDPFIALPDELEDPRTGDLIPSKSSNTDTLALYDSLGIVYRTYNFQGYQIYQLKNKSVSSADLFDEDLAKLVAQCDINDGIEDLINFEFDQDLDANVPKPKVENANNDGIIKSFRVSKDLFAAGDDALVNHKTYYYMAVAYAYNNFADYEAGNPETQDAPYLASRKGPVGPIQVFPAIPHKNTMENAGTVLNANYGDEVELTRIEGVGNGGKAVDFKIESLNEAFNLNIVQQPTYEIGRAPLTVKVVDPLNIKGGDYFIAFKDDTPDDNNLDDGYWVLYGEGLTDTIKSSTNLLVKKEEIVAELGISITVGNTFNPGEKTTEGQLQTVVNSHPTNGFIESSISYVDNNRQWMTGVIDQDGINFRNWIRSGSSAEINQDDYWDYDLTNTGNINGVAIDPEEDFEGVIDGTWAPFMLASNFTHGPATTRTGMNRNSFYRTSYLDENGSAKFRPAEYHLSYLNSINVYITSDKSKWTRCVVLEEQDDPTLVGGVEKLFPRNAPSVDKNGGSAAAGSGVSDNEEDPNYLSETGMGWFPGYAIDLETGERLNMAFGEDSYFESDNGNDMLWNPTDKESEGVDANVSVRFGGKHYIYVFRNNIVEEGQNTIPTTWFNDSTYRMPAYDGGKFMLDRLTAGTNDDFRAVFRAAAWTGAPMLRAGKSSNDPENPYSFIETDATIKIRTAKRFGLQAFGEAFGVGDQLTPGTEYLVNKGPIQFNGTTYQRGDVINPTTAGLIAAVTSGLDQTGGDNEENVVATQNGGRPLYKFNLSGLEASTNNSTAAENALDLIASVPNPYYAYSEYEEGKLDNRIKIINLPKRCDIKIYTMDGVLVREFSKDDESTVSIDWDLKNHARIPIASGIYIIHVDVPGVGEKVLKWFGVMRPVDLDSF